MLCTAIRHILSALAAVALFSAFAASPASAGSGDAMNMFQVIQKEMNASNPKTPKRLATQNSPRQTTTTHYPIRWWQDYGGGSGTRNLGQYFRNAHGSLD